MEKASSPPSSSRRGTEGTVSPDLKLLEELPGVLLPCCRTYRSAAKTESGTSAATLSFSQLNPHDQSLSLAEEESVIVVMIFNLHSPVSLS
ncbi:hypothetical protein DY000_02001052 [Brassica cretica]|uniref:Uncharacterized protein n=1 Tax=Brassica cretica TaxID=69181 RepID=A0ABQ7BRB6_BRACR|nr:hypothetical protein DY000_02001052 [Brassica cretica]